MNGYKLLAWGLTLANLAAYSYYFYFNSLWAIFFFLLIFPNAWFYVWATSRDEEKDCSPIGGYTVEIEHRAYDDLLDGVAYTLIINTLKLHLAKARMRLYWAKFALTDAKILEDGKELWAHYHTATPALPPWLFLEDE